MTEYEKMHHGMIYDCLTEELGAIHAAEIPYLFDTPIEDPMGSGKTVSNEDCEFRHVVKEMWTNFARTGNPSTNKYDVRIS